MPVPTERMACRFDFARSSNFRAKPVNRGTTQTDNYVCRHITDDWATEPLKKTFGKYSDCWTNNYGMAQVAKRHVQKHA